MAGKGGIQDIRFDEFRKNAIRVGPQIYPSAGRKTNFRGRGDLMVNSGGTGGVMLPLDIAQMPSSLYIPVVVNKSMPWPMAMKRSRYPARPYMAPAWDVVKLKFPQIFGNLNR